MKKINIEDLKREKAELPASFFDTMQEKVLDQTVKKHQIKFRPTLNWSIAATIAIIFGFIFSRENITSPQNTSISKGGGGFTSLNSLKKEEVSTIPEKKNTAYIGEEAPTLKAIKETDYSRQASSTKAKIEELLNTGDEEYYENLAGNYEQDVYLELY